MSTKRVYVSEQRASSAKLNRDRVLAAAKELFSTASIESVQIAEIAAKAGVSASTIYATFKSREGILRALMEEVLFGAHYTAALTLLEGERDPIRLILLSAGVARAIYEGESRELSLLRDIGAYSPALRAIEREFDDIRYAKQQQRIDTLFAVGLARPELDISVARRILWMYTSREVYRMLVTEGGWAPAMYQSWLEQTLMSALVRADAQLATAVP